MEAMHMDHQLQQQKAGLEAHQMQRESEMAETEHAHGMQMQAAEHKHGMAQLASQERISKHKEKQAIKPKPKAA
jgi:hypothetical protein